MANEDWKLQVSYKTPAGDMINIRANTADELSVLLEGVGDYSTQIASVQRLVVASYNAAPLGTPSSTPSTVTSGSFAPTPPAAQSLTPPPSAVTPAGTASPTCIHGARIFRQGVSKASGKPYAFWACPTPQGTPDQCKPVN
jgi:hypothetical protein